MSTPATRIQSASPTIVLVTDSGAQVNLRYPLSVLLASEIDPFDAENVFGGKPFGLDRALKFLAAGVIPAQRDEWTAQKLANDIDPSVAIRVATALIQKLAEDVTAASGGQSTENPMMPVR